MPAHIGHGIRNIVDVYFGSGRGESNDTYHGLTDDLEGRAQTGVLTDSPFELACCVDDLVAAVDVAGLADGHHAGPAACDQGAGTRAGHGRGGVDAAGPVGHDEVLVCTQRAVAVEHDGAALGGKAVLVGIDADAGDTRLAEVEAALVVVRGREAGLFEEGDGEGAQTAVDVQGDLVGDGQPREGRDVVDQAMGEVGGRSDQQHGVGIDEPADGRDVHDVVWGRAGDVVRLDAEVLAGLGECRMGGFRNDPTSY